MQVIGITGGVGSGKSALLSGLCQRYGARIRVIHADDVANEVKAPGGMCYNEIVSLLGEDVLDREAEAPVRDAEGRPLYPVDRNKMARMIFSDKALLARVNAILHPAVCGTVRRAIEEERKNGRLRALFIEAALLIEAGYEEIVDEMWVVTAPEDIRIRRLKEARGYSEEKIRDIFSSQLTQEQFLAHADRVIDNGGTQEAAIEQMIAYLGPDEE